MKRRAALHRLANCYGIEADYFDYAGQRHVISDETQEKLLAALGVDLDGDLAALADALATADWRHVLPPVQVLREDGEAFGIEFSLPVADALADWQWSLLLESGERREGVFRPAAWLPIAECRIDDTDYRRWRLPLPRLAAGYHRLELAPVGGQGGDEAERRAATSLIVTPARCYLPPALQQGGRRWGPTLQLYGLRSGRNWGIGDFTDLRNVVDLAAEAGAALVGVNPLHALFPDRPENCSPYSPSSRLFLNVLYIDVEAVADFQASAAAAALVAAPDFQARLARLRDSPLVDYPEVAAAKLAALRLAFAHFRDQHLGPGTARGEAFRQFCAAGGAALEQHAVFEALQARFHCAASAEAADAAEIARQGWPAWPRDFRSPEAAAVGCYAAMHRDEVDFYLYLQWLAEQQWGAVGQAGSGLGIGLYVDLALGIAPAGAEAWASQGCYAQGAHLGAPPDEFSFAGQDWGLLPLIPQQLRATAYAPFIATLRAAMRQAGALRIDHVMALQHVFWVPAGSPAAAGAYVGYRFDEMLGILALESQRHRCLVIGEDLGTVPAGFRQAVAARGVLSYRVLHFERNEDGGFQPPAAYPRQALAVVGTHDMATLSGFWQGVDLDARAAQGLLPTPAQHEAALIARAGDRVRLVLALQRAGLLPADIQAADLPAMTPELALAVHAYLAGAPAMLLGVQADDIFGMVDQANLPCSPASYPNWRRRLPLPLERWAGDARWQALADLLRRQRGSAGDSGASAGEMLRPQNQRLALGPQKQRLALGPQNQRLAVSPEGTDKSSAQQDGRQSWRVAVDSFGARSTAKMAQKPATATIPRATYRLQLNREFTLAQATDIVPYLAELGVSHCYLSPCLKARPGSSHGYDIVDYHAFNPEIGSAEDFRRFAVAVHRHAMGLILDIVPNHMGVMGADNHWWLDVLENGPASAYADYFDIDWQPLNAELAGKVLLPILGDHYGSVLDRGELRLAFAADQGEFSLHYQQHRLPIDPAEYPRLLGEFSEQAAAAVGADNERLLEWQSLITAFGHLPGRHELEAEKVAERRRDKEVHKRHLAALCAAEPALAQHVAARVAEFNAGGEAGGAGPSFDALHALIKAQAWRLAYWRVAADEINYRRFFDQSDLAALRMENSAVFEDGHRLLLSLVDEGLVDGLRIDHADGLYDPAQYFRRLQASVGGGEVGGRRRRRPLPLYLVIEKILAEHERLPDTWTIHGTTGYDFANLVNGLFVDGQAEQRLSRIYAEFTGRATDFDTLAHDAKKLIIRSALQGELNVLASQLSRIAAASRHTCDFTLNGLRGALAEVVACFPVYRSYFAAGQLSVQDRRHIERAVAVAKRRSPAADISVFDFIRAVLCGDIALDKSETYRQQVENFAMKFQQYSAPVMAKGLEDTAFYRYHRLVSLNDVGGDPRRFGVTPAAFHALNRARAERWPHTLLAGSTHDSKRSADVRARLDVLSEIPAAWKLAVNRWRRLNRSHKRSVDGRPGPSANDEYLLYQTLFGTWPLGEVDADGLADYRQRIGRYLLKAVREAKEHSSWININADYEAALAAFIDALLAPGEHNLFLADFAPAARRLARFGLVNGLAQTLIKLTAPGVPDLYQGSELWQFNLVDPDNRRPVDYALRRQRLAEVRTMQSTAWMDVNGDPTGALADGRLKLYLTWCALQLRRRWPEVFRDGDYLPLPASGRDAAHVCAYARRLGERTAITVVPRLNLKRQGGRDADPAAALDWGDTHIVLPPPLAGGEWLNVLTGERLPAATPILAVDRLLAHFPVALLAHGPGALAEGNPHEQG